MRDRRDVMTEFEATAYAIGDLAAGAIVARAAVKGISATDDEIPDSYRLSALNARQHMATAVSALDQAASEMLTMLGDPDITKGDL